MCAFLPHLSLLPPRSATCVTRRSVTACCARSTRCPVSGRRQRGRGGGSATGTAALRSGWSPLRASKASTSLGGACRGGARFGVHRRLGMGEHYKVHLRGQNSQPIRVISHQSISLKLKIHAELPPPPSRCQPRNTTHCIPSPPPHTASAPSSGSRSAA